MPSNPQGEYGGSVTNSPHNAEDGFQSIPPKPRVDVDGLPSDEEDGHHSPSHTVPSKSNTYPPVSNSPDSSHSRRRQTWGGRNTNRGNSNTQGPVTPIVSRLQRAVTILATLGKPEVPVGKPPTIWKQLRNIVFASPINILLLAIPISWALHFAVPGQYLLVFLFSFLAIIPLAKLLAFATEELSLRVGETLAGLINATLGNAVELIVAILALIKCELRVVQSSLVGSILSNLLLVLGFCFFAGGTRFSEQGFAISSTQLNSSLLTLSVIGVLIPAAFDMVTGNGQIKGFDSETEQRDILKLSHGVAVVLLIIYLSYLYFQLFSHKSLYENEDKSRPETVNYPPGPSRTDAVKEKARKVFRIARRDTEEHPEEDEEEKEAEPELSLSMAVGLLVVVTVLVAVTAEWLVDSIDGLASGGTISKEFIGLILLPIVGNAAEHVTAVTVSVKDKLTLSLGVAVGSSIQIALFVIPFTMILGWIIGRPITMLFDPFESILLFFAVLTVNYVVQDGKSNWLEGMILICLYVIVALVSWFYPGTEPTGLLTCTA